MLKIESKKNNYLFPFILMIVILIIVITDITLGFEENELINKIAFLHQQEVWLINPDGSDLKQFTHTGGNVLDFLFSPSLGYFAYFYITGYTDDWGFYDEGEEIPQIPIYSLIIMDLKTQKVLRNIPAPGDIHLHKWLPDDRLLLHTSAGGAVSSYEVYHGRTNNRQVIDYQKWSQWEQLRSTDFHLDGTVMTYLDEAGRLHMVDLTSKADKVIYANKEVILSQISNSKRYIAGINKKANKIWIYNRKIKTLQGWDGQINDWYNIYLQWSFDDRYLMTFTQGQAIIVDNQNPKKSHKIMGYNFTWTTNNLILIEEAGRNADLFLYDIRTDKKSLFQKDACYAQVCGRNEKVFTH